LRSLLLSLCFIWGRDGIEEVTGSNPVGSTNETVGRFWQHHGNSTKNSPIPSGAAHEAIMAKKVIREKPHPVRALGIDRGRIGIADDFDSPLPADIMTHFLLGAAALEDDSTKSPLNANSGKADRKNCEGATQARARRQPGQAFLVFSGRL
jgi:hypothetical protein